MWLYSGGTVLRSAAMIYTPPVNPPLCTALDDRTSNHAACVCGWGCVSGRECEGSSSRWQQTAPSLSSCISMESSVSTRCMERALIGWDKLHSRRPADWHQSPYIQGLYFPINTELRRSMRSFLLGSLMKASDRSARVFSRVSVPLAGVILLDALLSSVSRYQWQKNLDAVEVWTQETF